jgi:hypothetical protein
MGAGVTLAVLGAILAFAVRTTPPGLDLHVVGLILMVAGGALILHARRGNRRERVITRVEQPSDPTRAPHTIRETIRDVDPE